MESRILFLTSLLVLVYSAVGLLLFIESREMPSTRSNYSNNNLLLESEGLSREPEKEEESEPLTLALVGDIMMDRGVRQMVYQHGGGDHRYITGYLDFLKEYDVVFGNLEGPLSDQGYDRGHLYSFRMEPEVLPALTDNNFSVLSVANNHAGDWGREAFEDTLDRLDKAGVKAVGGGKDREDAIQPVFIDKKGKTIGFVGFTDLGPRWLEAGPDESGILWADGDYHDRAISEAVKQSDILVVSYHYGVEYAQEPNYRQREISRRAVDLGADIVAGHHPHVIQPVELYEDGVIAYSLGNFIFDQYFSPETMEGLVLVVEFKGDDIKVTTQEVELTDHYQPQLREEKKYPDLIYQADDRTGI